MRDADLVLVVVPSHAFTETLLRWRRCARRSAGVAWATKGFEPGSGRFLHEVAAQVLGPGRAAGGRHRAVVRQGSRRRACRPR